MSQNLTISETGLRLIKAFEGYRPVDRELITGQRIVGHGHRLYSEDAVTMNKGEAEATLRADLAPFEDMINTEVHAPMSQSQFDALCSFAFNIGPKAFLQSDTLRALNNGRPLDAANGLDIWRKSEIDGKVYVVDALMRRRTAEKALFLRTKRDVPAGREDLPPVQDTTIIGLSTEDALPVFTENDSNGIVATAPYDAADTPHRRIEDGPAGALQLSERDVMETENTPDESTVLDFQTNDDAALDDQPLEPLDLDLDLDLDLGLDLGSKDTKLDIELLDVPEERPMPTSPIAAAATDIVARLDALIDGAVFRNGDRDTDWPESLVTANGDTEDNYFVTDPAETAELDDQENIIDLKSRVSRDTDATRASVNEVETKAPAKTVALQETTPQQETKPVKVIDELAQDDAYKIRTDSAAKYIETTEPLKHHSVEPRQGGTGVWILVVLGFLLVGLAGGAMMRDSQAILGDWGPIISFSGFVIGVGLILAGIYAALRMNRGD